MGLYAQIFVLFFFVNWILSGSWSKNSKWSSLPDSKFYRNQRVFRSRCTLSQSSPAVRNAAHLQTFCFRLTIFMPFDKFLSASSVLCNSIYSETALNSRKECNEFAILPAIRENKFPQIEITANIFPAKSYSRVNILQLIFATQKYSTKKSCLFNHNSSLSFRNNEIMVIAWKFVFLLHVLRKNENIINAMYRVLSKNRKI